MQPTDFDRQVRAYRDTVFSCVNINATAMAGVPLRLYVAKGSKSTKFKLTETKEVSSQRKDYLFSEATLQPYLRKAVDVEEVTEHPFFDLLRNVNGFNNQFDLKELTTIFLELTGNGYWYLPKNGLGTPAEIWVLYSQWMTVVPDPKKLISGYVLTRGMKTINFNEDEIIHFKYPSPHSEFYGMGPLMGAANAYDLEKDMNDYEKALFRHMGRPDMALIAKEGLGKGQPERIREQWKSTYGGPKKAGKVAILQGDLEIKEFGFPPREMSYLVGRKKTKEQIANAFGIPMSMLTTEAVNLANAQAGNYQHAKNAVLPRCRRFEEKLNEKLLPMYDDKLFVAFDNPVPADKEFRLKERESNIKSQYSSVNLERQIDGQEAVPWGDVPLVPVNIMPLGSAPVPTEQESFEDLVKDVAREIAEKIGDSPINDDKLLPNEEKGKCTIHNHQTRNDIQNDNPNDNSNDNLNDEKLQEQKWLDFIKRQSPYEKKFTVKLRELFSAQEKEVLANMKHLPKAVKKGWEEDWLFNEAEWNKRFAEEGRPFIGGVMEEVGRAELVDLVSGIDFDVTNPRVIGFLNRYVPKYAFEVNEATQAQLLGALKEGIAAGESMQLLKMRVRGVFGFAENHRSLRIARTETIRASNFGAEEAFRQSGVVKGKKWLTSFDDRTCEIGCKELNGKTSGLGKPFPKGGVSAELDYTDGAIPNPPLHPQCRCTIIAVLK